MSRGRHWEKKEPEDIRGYHAYMIIWKSLVGKCVQCMKEPTNKMSNIVVAVVSTNSRCKEVVFGHKQQNSP